MTQVLDRLSDGSAKQWLAQHLDHADSELCLTWPFGRASNGYGQIGRDRHIPHRIMCEHRHGPAPTSAHQAAHSCGNGHLGCVNPLHLNWKTPAENQIERYQHCGLAPRNKLTPAQVDEIRGLKGREIIARTGARFGVNEANIRQIQSGKTWKADSQRRRPLTQEEVRLIRSVPWQIKSARQFATELGVSMSCIEHVRSGDTYQWVADTAEPTQLVPSQDKP